MGFQRAARGNLGQFRVFLPLYLQAAGVIGGPDTLSLHRLIGGDAQAFRLLLRLHLGLVDGNGRLRAFGLNLGLLRGLADFDGAALVDAGKFQIAVNFQRAARGLVILLLDVDARLVLDLVADLAAVLDLFGQLGQALGVKGV